jgi:hypothetical protein
MISMRWVVLLVALVLGCGPCDAKVYRLRVTLEDGSTARASAVCIGRTSDGCSLFATARHNFDGAILAEVVTSKWAARTKEVIRHESEDVAVFTIGRDDCEPTELEESDPLSGETAYVDGYGPEYHNQPESQNCRYSGTITQDYVAGHDGLHPITGDSGGPVAVIRRGRYKIVGVVSGYSPSSQEYLRSRFSYREKRFQTIYTPARAIQHCLQQRWQYGGCPPGGCPIYVRPQVQQPMIGIGIPTGPPRVVGVAEPAPIAYQPAAPPDVADAVRRATRDWLEANREQLRGDPGKPGERGPEGAAGRTVSKEMATEIITQWLESNKDQLRGERGLIGVPSEAEIAAVIDTWIERNDPRIREFVREVIREESQQQSSGDVDARLTALEARRLRMMIVDGSSKSVLDDETYDPGEPVILDIRRLRGSPDAK